MLKAFPDMSGLVIKKIKRIFNTETPTKKTKRKYKRFRKEFIPGESGVYVRNDLMSSIIMNCRIPKTVEFRSKLGLNQHGLIMTKKQSTLTKIMKVFAKEEMLLQHYVLGNRVSNRS